jgi:ribosomal protein L11 methyltransferase
MRWTEADFLIDPVDPWRDILMVELMDLGYEAFEESPHGLKAYILSEHFTRGRVNALRIMRDPHVTINFSAREVPDINWNARWEREFQPIELDGQVRVRAEFHPAKEGFRHDIIITPRMAFGTGHHATTRMMMLAMLQLDLAGQQVCDLGCGTGVLAILAEKLGAATVLAIDNDPEAVGNARRNAASNRCQRVVVEKGGTDLKERDRYGTILANIERNTLVHAMPAMSAALSCKGRLLLSGFVKKDEEVLAEAARKNGLGHVLTMEEGEWALSQWEKQDPDHRA